jgi:hypothetical protein
VYLPKRQRETGPVADLSVYRLFLAGPLGPGSLTVRPFEHASV